MTEDLKKDFIWHRALEVPGQDPNEVRQDYAGAIIHWDEYGHNTDYGWTIVPLVPFSKGGEDQLMSLLPYHVQNAMAKGDNFPFYETVLSSNGLDNVEKHQTWDYLTKL